MLTPEQKQHVIELIDMGDQLEAVRYLQNTLHISAEQAMVLAEKLQQEIETENEAAFRAKAAELQQKHSSGTNVGKTVGGIFMVIGIIFLVIAGLIVYFNYTFTQRAVTIKGKVLSYETYESRNDDGGSTTMYRLAFQYEYQGKTYTHVSSGASSSPEFQEGEELDIMVDPKDPDEILINSFMEQWFASVLLGGMGVVFGGLGFLVYKQLGKKA
jgi:hypothetical protein